MRTGPSKQHNQIAEILLRAWDPIGVADEPAAQDEYDSYVPVIGAMIRRGASAVDIAAHLVDIAEDAMGLAPDRGKALAVAQRLAALNAG